MPYQSSSNTKIILPLLFNFFEALNFSNKKFCFYSSLKLLFIISLGKLLLESSRNFGTRRSLLKGNLLHIILKKNFSKLWKVKFLFHQNVSIQSSKNQQTLHSNELNAILIWSKVICYISTFLKNIEHVLFVELSDSNKIKPLVIVQNTILLFSCDRKDFLYNLDSFCIYNVHSILLKNIWMTFWN